jgi:hypothetical protein
MFLTALYYWQAVRWILAEEIYRASHITISIYPWLDHFDDAFISFNEIQSQMIIYHRSSTDASVSCIGSRVQTRVVMQLGGAGRLHFDSADPYVRHMHTSSMGYREG